MVDQGLVLLAQAMRKMRQLEAPRKLQWLALNGQAMPVAQTSSDTSPKIKEPPKKLTHRVKHPRYFDIA